MIESENNKEFVVVVAVLIVEFCGSFRGEVYDCVVLQNSASQLLSEDH